jgi:hypothetical protein
MAMIPLSGISAPLMALHPLFHYRQRVPQTHGFLSVPCPLLSVERALLWRAASRNATDSYTAPAQTPLPHAAPLGLQPEHSRSKLPHSPSGARPISDIAHQYNIVSDSNHSAPPGRGRYRDSAFRVGTQHSSFRAIAAGSDCPPDLASERVKIRAGCTPSNASPYRPRWSPLPSGSPTASSVVPCTSRKPPKRELRKWGGKKHTRTAKHGRLSATHKRLGTLSTSLLPR